MIILSVFLALAAQGKPIQVQPAGALTRQQTTTLSPDSVADKKSQRQPIILPKAAVQSLPQSYESETVHVNMAEQIGNEVAATEGLKTRVQVLEDHRENKDRPDIDDLQSTRHDLRFLFVFLVGALSTLTSLVNKRLRRWVWGGLMSWLRAELIRNPINGKSRR